MTREETLDYLRGKGVEFGLEEHVAVFTIDEMIAAGVSNPELIAKNLFVCDDKKRNFFLITVRDDVRVDLKSFGKSHGIGRLRFAPEDRLGELLGLTRGAVTPLGLLADEGRKVTLYIDSYFDGKKIGVHPCDNTATVWLAASELVRLVEEHGNPVVWFDGSA